MIACFFIAKIHILCYHVYITKLLWRYYVNKHKLLSYIMLFLITFSIIIPIATVQAAPIDNVLTTQQNKN